VARFGSIALRHAGLSDYVCLPGGKLVLSAGRDRILRFWEMSSGRQVREVHLQGKARMGHGEALTPDGKTLVALDGERLVFWEVDSGKEVKALPAPKGKQFPHVAVLCFSPDGKTLGVWSWDMQVTLYEWQSGRERRIALAPRRIGFDSTYHGSFSPDGKLLVGGGGSGEALCLIETSTGRELHRLHCHACTSVFTPDGKQLAVCSMQNDKGAREGVIRVFDVASGREVRQLALGEESYFSLDFSPDGKKLVCGFSDHSRVLDAVTGRVLYRLMGRPIQMSFSRDGKTLLGSTGKRLRLWDATTGKERHERPGDFDWDPAIAMSPDGGVIASGGWMAQEVSLWDARSGRLLHRLPVKGKGRYVRNLAFSGDGKTLAAGQGMGFLQFWDSATGKELRSVQLHEAGAANPSELYFYHLHFSGDLGQVSTQDRRFGMPGALTRLGQWSTADGALQREHMLKGEVRHGAWRADGKAVALLLQEGLTWMDASTGAVRFKIAGTQDNLLAASPDERLLASPWKAGTVGVWESLTGKEVASVAAGRVAHLALTPDNRSLVTTDERFLRVHDLATGKERRRWRLPVAMADSWGRTFVQALHLSPDGRRAFTALADGSGLIWELSSALQSAPAGKVPGKKELAAWWTDLASEDARRAYAALWQLAQAPHDAVVSFVARQLQPPPVDAKEVRRLIDELDSDTFAVREKATRRLEALGAAALPALRDALAKGPSLEVRRRLEKLLARGADLAVPEVRRRLRALQVLERAGSREAQQVLTTLARGWAQAPEVQEAQAALERLARRAGRP
jgi:WD40 repeat protein